MTSDPVVILSLAVHLAVAAILVGYVARALARALERPCRGCAGWEAASRTAWDAVHRERALHDEARVARDAGNAEVRRLDERVAVLSAALEGRAGSSGTKPGP